jgi:hypothetical protein
MARQVILAVLLSTLVSTSTKAGGPVEFGLELMPAARKVSAQRYQSDRNYEATLKFFREKFRGAKNIRFLREVSVPGVKYLHIENDNPTSGWDGLNISQMPDGTVQVFVLERLKASPMTTTTGASPTSTAAPKPAAPVSPR